MSKFNELVKQAEEMLKAQQEQEEIESVVEQEAEVMLEQIVETPVSKFDKKAYNIWYDKTGKMYYLDVVEYGADGVKISTEKLTTSQALAVRKINEIFAMKLILRKEGV